MIIPSLKRALTKAVLAPIILPKSLLLSMAFNHTQAEEGSNSNAVLVPAFDASNDLNVTVTHPGDLVKLAFEDLSQAGEGVVHALVNKSSNPLEIVTKGILNCNVTDIKKAIPQVNGGHCTLSGNLIRQSLQEVVGFAWWFVAAVWTHASKCRCRQNMTRLVKRSASAVNCPALW